MTLPQGTDPELLLFLSVDVVGSTAYKQSRIGTSGETWLGPFVAFATSFRKFFDHALIMGNKKAEEEKVELGKPEAPRLWKSLGDELIFTVPLRSSVEAPYFVWSFKEAVGWYKKDMERRFPELSVKATGWVAGFPLINRKIRIGEADTDYIGPQIDIGFRIAKYSTSRRFTVSVGLAYMLTIIHRSVFPLNIYYEGQKEVKGVLESGQYPMFWIDVPAEKPDLEEPLLGGARDCPDTKHVVAFCADFLRNADPLCVPFIEGDALLNVKPDRYEEEVQELVERERDYYTTQPEPPDTGNASSDALDKSAEFIEGGQEKKGTVLGRLKSRLAGGGRSS